jgi:hypothetical protein
MPGAVMLHENDRRHQLRPFPLDRIVTATGILTIARDPD